MNTHTPTIKDLDDDPIKTFPIIHPAMKGSLLDARLRKDPSSDTKSIWDTPPTLSTVNSIFRPGLHISNRHLIKSVRITNLVVDSTFDPVNAMVGSASGIHPSEIAKSNCGDPSGRVPTSHGGTGTQYDIKTNTAVFVDAISHATLAIMINRIVHISRRARLKTSAAGPSTYKKVTINMQPQRLRLRFRSPQDIQHRAINTVVSARRFPGVSYKISGKKRMPDGSMVETVVPDGLTCMAVKGSENVIVTGRPQSEKRIRELLNMAFRDKSWRYALAIGDETGEQTPTHKHKHAI